MAYMCPAGSSVQANTTPLATDGGPEALPAGEGTVCHSRRPVAASRALQMPVVTVRPSSTVQGRELELASAVYTRRPSVAEPHCRPPAVPPGPMVLVQT